MTAFAAKTLRARVIRPPVDQNDKVFCSLGPRTQTYLRIPQNRSLLVASCPMLLWSKCCLNTEKQEAGDLQNVFRLRWKHRKKHIAQDLHPSKTVKFVWCSGGGMPKDGRNRKNCRFSRHQREDEQQLVFWAYCDRKLECLLYVFGGEPAFAHVFRFFLDDRKTCAMS